MKILRKFNNVNCRAMERFEWGVFWRFGAMRFSDGRRLELIDCFLIEIDTTFIFIVYIDCTYILSGCQITKGSFE